MHLDEPLTCPHLWHGGVLVAENFGPSTLVGPYCLHRVQGDVGDCLDGGAHGDLRTWLERDGLQPSAWSGDLARAYPPGRAVKQGVARPGPVFRNVPPASATIERGRRNEDWGTAGP